MFVTPNDLIKNEGFNEKATKIDNYLLIKKESKIDPITMGNKESVGVVLLTIHIFNLTKVRGP